jgi:ABC-type nitrate/sulfonate/bicarbonate transport system permease component
VRPVLRKLAGYAVGFAMLFGAWALAAAWLNSPTFPGPLPTLAEFVDLWPVIWPETLLSLYRVLAAMFIGAALAVPLGLAIGRSKRADAIVTPVVSVVYPIPKVVFLPVLLILLGLGDAPKITLIALIIFFQILVTARDAARAVPEGSVLSVRSLGAGRLDVARHVVVPAALPEIFTALRIGSGTAIAVLFIAEATAGSSGIGWFIVDAWGRIDYLAMFAGIVAMGLLGIVLYEALDALESWVTRWRRTSR